MKNYLFYLMFLLALPAILNAQYTGENGGGDFGSGVYSSNLYGSDLLSLYKGGIGSGASSGGGVNVPLPVELISLYSAIINKRDVIINWTTALELNNAGFEIHRSDQNNDKNWIKIGYVQGNGTCNTPNVYIYKDSKLNKGKYVYRLKQIDYNGNFEYHNLAGEVNIGIPAKFYLSQNHPNPFNPVTKINFELPVDCKVTIKVFDITGRESAVLLNNELKSADYYTIDFDGSKLTSGVYFYKISAGDFSQSKKMILLK